MLLITEDRLKLLDHRRGMKGTAIFLVLRHPSGSIGLLPKNTAIFVIKVDHQRWLGFRKAFNDRQAQHHPSISLLGLPKTNHPYFGSPLPIGYRWGFEPLKIRRPPKLTSPIEIIKFSKFYRYLGSSSIAKYR